MILARKSVDCHYENATFFRSLSCLLALSNELMRYGEGKKKYHHRSATSGNNSQQIAIPFMNQNIRKKKVRGVVFRVFSCPFLLRPFGTICPYIIYAQIVHIQTYNCASVFIHNQMLKSHQQNGIQWGPWLAKHTTWWGHCRPLIMLSIYWNFNLNLRKIAKWFRSSFFFSWTQHILKAAAMPISSLLSLSLPPSLLNSRRRFSIQYIRFAKCNFICLFFFLLFFLVFNSTCFLLLLAFLVYDSYSIYSIP